MTFAEFKNLVHNIQYYFTPYIVEEVKDIPVKVMYNGNEYNFDLSTDQPGMVVFINAYKETKTYQMLINELQQILDTFNDLYQKNPDPKFDVKTLKMDHEYDIDLVMTFSKNKTYNRKIIFYISESENL